MLGLAVLPVLLSADENEVDNANEFLITTKKGGYNNKNEAEVKTK